MCTQITSIINHDVSSKYLNRKTLNYFTNYIGKFQRTIGTVFVHFIVGELFLK